MSAGLCECRVVFVVYCLCRLHSFLGSSRLPLIHILLANLVLSWAGLFLLTRLRGSFLALLLVSASLDIVSSAESDSDASVQTASAAALEMLAKSWVICEGAKIMNFNLCATSI